VRHPSSKQAQGRSGTRRPEFIMPVSPPPIGTLLLKEGLIRSEQLEEALQHQRSLASPKPLGQILVEARALTARQLNHFLRKYGKRPRLGDILVANGTITPEQFALALEHHSRSGIPLGKALIELNYCSEEAMRQALCLQLNIPYLELDKIGIDPSMARWITKGYARRHLVVPVAQIGKTITLAMDDPTDLAVIEELQSFTGYSLNIVTSTRACIRRAFSRIYDNGSSSEADSSAVLELVADDLVELPPNHRHSLEEAHSRKADHVVRKILQTALDSRASDIHLETLDQHVCLRFRIDGVLQQLHMGGFESDLDEQRREIISRIKILGKLDITERRRPQDGSFRIRIQRGGHRVNIDLRISIIPGYYGENVVLRILDPKNAPRSIGELGFSKRMHDRLNELLRTKDGILLIAGPTGSGKSTTLFAALMTLYRPGIRILTAEDPIEYVYEKFSQSEVNERIGNSFAHYLRAFLRHDPEVIMIGEIRDSETAVMAFRAAQTGHLLLSTIHTNDAVSSVVRLLDLGIDANLIASAVRGVVSQRLVRKTCERCREPYVPAPELLREFFAEVPAGLDFFKGRGCAECNFTGYRGRWVAAELWVPNNQDVILINKGAPFDQIRASSLQSTLLIAESIRGRLREGATTLEELIRALPYSCIQQFRQGEAMAAEAPGLLG